MPAALDPTPHPIAEVVFALVTEAEGGACSLREGGAEHLEQALMACLPQGQLMAAVREVLAIAWLLETRQRQAAVAGELRQSVLRVKDAVEQLASEATLGRSAEARARHRGRSDRLGAPPRDDVVLPSLADGGWTSAERPDDEE